MADRIRSQRISLVLIAVTLIGLVVFLFVIVRTAWLSDDAYITFRTIKILAAGGGPNYNLGERVQAYTHPLWFALLTSVFYFSHELYFTPIFLSIAMSAATALLATMGLIRQPWGIALFFSGAILSAAYIDYSTSGLENPLTFFLIVAILVATHRWETRPWYLFGISLGSTLLFLTRPDLAVVAAPMLVSAWWRSKDRERAAGKILMGLLPSIAWEAFSVFYYGFPFPNTAFAKLNTGYPRTELVTHGLNYLLSSLIHDPLTLVVIVVGTLAAWRWRTRVPRSIAAGSLLYLCYVVVIGGDFMRGRLLTVPFLIGLLGVATASKLHGIRELPVIAACLVLGLLPPHPTLFSGPEYSKAVANKMDPWGVSDERAYYFAYTGLMRESPGGGPASNPASLQGRTARENGEDVAVRGTLGLFGFYAGRWVHVVDRSGLSDPLLSRLTPLREPNWRIGHTDHRIPKGYLESLQSGGNRIADPSLHRYYDKLRIVVRGPLWGGIRLRTILWFNLGRYDHLLTDYERRTSG